VYNANCLLMARIVSVCRSTKDTREKTVAEGILKEDCRRVGDSTTHVCERVWRIATDGK
jgi:hypothetical protein